MLYPKYCAFFKKIAKIDVEKIRKMLRKDLLDEMSTDLINLIVIKKLPKDKLVKSAIPYLGKAVLKLMCQLK